jgi:hypothetical protein
MVHSEAVSYENIKADLTMTMIPGRLRTSKDAARLLESLRTGYQSLSPERREEIKALMVRVFESQPRAGTPNFVEEPVTEALCRA